jgi:hypothetical protein
MKYLHCCVIWSNFFFDGNVTARVFPINTFRVNRESVQSILVEKPDLVSFWKFSEYLIKFSFSISCKFGNKDFIWLASVLATNNLMSFLYTGQTIALFRSAGVVRDI